jgi:hypothetical protein
MFIVCQTLSEICFVHSALAIHETEGDCGWDGQSHRVWDWQEELGNGEEVRAEERGTDQVGERNDWRMTW